MHIDIESKPSYGMAVVTLDKGETVVAESGAMAAMDAGLSVDTTFNGTGGGGLAGLLKAVLAGLARRFLAGESLFVNRYTATADGQRVLLAPAVVGDVVHLPMGQRAVTVQATSYLASSPGVAVELVWGGLSMLLSGEGVFFLRCTGTGGLLVNSYGAIEKVEVDGGYVVDSGHVVAFEGDLGYRLRRAGSWKSTLFSGEGFVQEFTGKGTVWVQTRNVSALVSWITPHLPA